MFGWQLRPGLHAGAGAFNPRSLFRSGEQGVLYDPNDLSALFQDSAGTTPVTAADQPVGLMLDKRLGLVRGPELVADGGFDAGVTAFPYVARGTVTHGLSSAVLTTTSIAGTSGVTVALPSAPVFPVAGRYEVRITVSSRSVANASHRLLVAVSSGQNSGLSATERFYAPGVGEYTGILNATTSNTLTISSIDGAATIGDTFTLSSISIRELPGNHAFQATAASRPILRQNATTGAYYLETDGSDDWMQTNAINFTGTDKVSVFTGVRKLSDAAFGTFVELSADFNVNNGTFILAAPAVSPTRSYRFVSRGTAAQSVGSTNFAPAPSSNVITGLADISGQSVSIRSNGVVIEALSASLGTGEYGNYPLYLFRRGGTSLPFAGHFYGLTIVGRLCTAAEIRAIERLYAAKTGVILA